MKKLLAIIVLGLLSNNNSFSDEKRCFDSLSHTWKMNDSSTHAVFKFESVSDKPITIESLSLWTSGEQLVKRHTVNLNLKPFGVGTAKTYVADLNRKVIKQGSYICKYTPKTITKKKNYKPKSKSSAQKWLDKIRGN
jgi:hypothetical protein